VQRLGKEQNADNVESLGSKMARGALLVGAGVTGLIGISGLAYADEAEHGLHSPEYPWPHNGILSSYDHAS
jgi:ubiquinol-cytochrome c reductase cytochrome c1 subunit